MLVYRCVELVVARWKPRNKGECGGGLSSACSYHVSGLKKRAECCCILHRPVSLQVTVAAVDVERVEHTYSIGWGASVTPKSKYYKQPDGFSFLYFLIFSVSFSQKQSCRSGQTY